MTFDPRNEKRRYERFPVALQARIEIPLRPPVPCIVRDITVEGALLEFTDAAWVPNHFHLHIEPGGFDAPCDVRHRQGSQHVGVAFDPAYRSDYRHALASLGARSDGPGPRSGSFGRRGR